jgi:hypothetical protein
MWNADRGFGFIKDDAGGPDVFLHISALQSSGLDPENLRLGADGLLAAIIPFDSYASPILFSDRALIGLIVLPANASADFNLHRRDLRPPHGGLKAKGK